MTLLHLHTLSSRGGAYLALQSLMFLALLTTFGCGEDAPEVGTLGTQDVLVSDVEVSAEGGEDSGEGADASDAGVTFDVAPGGDDAEGALPAPDAVSPSPACGDGICAVGESTEGCPEDCAPSCGDGLCSAGESPSSCAADCGSPCGDGLCAADESVEGCPEDCALPCGDGTCASDESYETCPEDCSAEDPGPEGMFDPQREAWRAEGIVTVEGNRLMVGGEPYYPKTDFLTAMYPGDDWSLWSSLYYFGFDAAKRQSLKEALVDAKYNSIYIFTLNIGDGVITPYGEGGFSADTNALNQARVDDWKAAVEDLIAHQLKPFIWLAGDDSPAVAAMSLEAWKAYVDDMVEAFEEYPIVWVIGLEVDEYWSPAEVEARRTYLASKTQHLVGVHLTIAETTNTATPYQENFDFVMGQFHSPQSDADYAAQTVEYTLPDVPWIASEFNVFGTGDGDEAVGSVTERSQDIGVVIASVGDPPLVAGIGNGIDLTGEPPAPPEGPPEDFSGIIWLHTDVSDWPETSTLSSVSLQGGQICMDYDKANSWPIAIVDGSSGPVEVVANPWVFIKHEGQWYEALGLHQARGPVVRGDLGVAAPRSDLQRQELGRWKPHQTVPLQGIELGADPRPDLLVYGLCAREVWADDRR